ncbi:MAG: hypothetical protein V7631_4394, partial [Massilia sp.]
MKIKPPVQVPARRARTWTGDGLPDNSQGVADCVESPSFVGESPVISFESPTMKPVVISGTGLFTPPYSISN